MSARVKRIVRPSTRSTLSISAARSAWTGRARSTSTSTGVRTPSGGLAQRGPRGAGVQALGRQVGAALLHDDGDHPLPNKVAGLLRHELVAGDEQDRDPMGAGDGGVQAELAHRLPVYPHIEDGAGEGVAQHGRPGAGPAVDADEHRRVVAPVDPVDHAEQPRLAPEERRPLVEVLRDQVAVRAVDVGDGDPRAGDGVEDAGDNRVRLPGHQAPGALVLRVARRALLAVDDARDPFDVDGDENAHRGNSR